MQEAPVRSPLEVVGTEARWSRPWMQFFPRLLNAIGWSFALTNTKTHDFGSIGGASQASTTVTVTGARAAGFPTVLVTPSADTAGIIYTGVVTANDTVTIYAKNPSAGSIDPGSTTFRVTVLQ